VTLFIIILTHIDHLTISPAFPVGKLDTSRERRDGDSVRLNILQTGTSVYVSDMGHVKMYCRVLY